MHGQAFAASNLFAVSDAEADTITQYDFWNIGSGGGRFVVGAIARGTNQDIYVSAAQLAQANYRSGSGSDTLYVRAFDGFVWGAWSRAFTVTAPVDAGAVLTASDKTVAKGATIAASALFSATDSDGDTIASYQLWDSTTGSGRFVVNGIGQLSRQAINVTAAQLSQTYFQGGSNSTDDLWVRASDGYLISNWVEFHVSAPNQLPIVTVSNQTGAPGQGILSSSLFSATDADGDSVQNVQFWNSNGDAASGYFVVNGVVQGANQAIAVSAANLANASFQFDTEADQLWVRVNDGTDWSPWQSFVATPTSGIPAGNKAPVVSVGTQSATHGQSLAGSSLLSASDPDADPIIKYQFWNSTGDPASGYFVLNGMAEPVQQSIEVTAAQLPSFSFQSGSGNDLLWVRASDGFQWSSWQSFTVTAPVDHAPVVTASDISATHRQSFAAASLFSVTDADNDTMAKYEFWDSSDPSAGQFVVNGTSEPSNQPIDVSAADLANTSFQSGSGTALLWVRANDGMLWSSWVPFHLTAPADQAPVVAGNDTAIALNQSVAVSSLFTVMDPENDPITAYEFWNSSPDPSNGYFIANAQVQPADQVIDVSAAQLGQTRFVAGSQVGATDLIWERANDGMQWSAWHSLTVTSFQPAGPPTPQFDLAPADQSGAPGSHQAHAATVTLVGHTGVNDTVALMSGDTTLATTTSSNTGAFQFANVSLVQGDNALTTKSSDSSGQSSTFSLSIDRLPPSGSINAALSWNQATLAAIKQDASTPEFASRALAMESLAVFDAVSAIDGTPGYLLNMSAPSGTDANAAAAQAAHDVLAYLYPAQKATLDADLASSLADNSGRAGQEQRHRTRRGRGGKDHRAARQRRMERQRHR